MCGIVGVFSKSVAIDAKDILAMTDAIEHRGPDGFGYLCTAGVVNQDVLNNNHSIAIQSNADFAFGHRRLAIHDLSDNGLQPMSYQGRYWIVFNGEIYNYLELRQELEQKKYQFKTDTDTEVIMAAYDAWGKDCLNKFNGMWAFVILDTEKNEIFISRDRFGIKPLYYYQDDDVFIFSSEIKAIRAYTGYSTQVNLKYVAQYLKNGTVAYEKQTAFEDIYIFDNACYEVCKINDVFKTVEPKQYYQLTCNEAIEPFCPKKAKEYADQYYKLLEDSVRLRLRSDVAVGSALSGGLDSSSIVYLVNQILTDQKKEDLQETFSSVFQDDATRYCDESIFINALADTFDIKTNFATVTEDNVLRLHEKVIKHYENLPDNSCVSGMALFERVKATKVKVTLDGQGADEKMAGYLGYVNSLLFSLPYKQFLKESWCFIRNPQVRKHVLFSFVFRHVGLFIGKKRLNTLLKRFFGSRYEINLNKRLLNDFKGGLQNLFHYSDSASMACSIESRVPFLDYRLVDFWFAMPASYKIHHGWTKYIARLAFDNKLPKSICWRVDKMGWPSPDRYWFRESPLKHKVMESVQASQLLKRLVPGLDIEKVMQSKGGTTQLLRYYNVSKFEKHLGLDL